MRDPLLPHQIYVGKRWHPIRGTYWLYVSCNCLHVAGDVYDPLDTRELYEPGEARAIWRAHMAEVAA
jgi:hypothetical protein